MTLPGFIPCETCGGAATVTHPGATEREWLEGLREHVCPWCSGVGVVPDPETVEAAAKAIHQRFVDENSQRYGIDIPAWEVDAEPWKEHMRSNAKAALLAYARRVLDAAST